MSTVKGKNKLCSTPASGISVESIGGIPFYDRYVEFDHLLQKYIMDRRYKDSFAEPLFNGTNGTIDWYVPSQYSGIPRLEDLKGTAEYDDAVRQKDACIQYLKRQMLDMPDHDRQYFDCLVKYANSDISDFTTFYSNGHVIFGVWGLHLNGMKDISMAIRTDIDDRRVYTISYLMSGKGAFTGVESVIKRKHGHVLNGARDIPNVIPDEGYEFSSWEPDAPHNKVVESDLTFTAVCTEAVTPVEPEPEEEPVVAPVVEEPVPEMPTFSNVQFDPANNGKLKGPSAVQAQNGKILDPAVIPQVKPKRGFDFIGWDKDTTVPITKDTVFKAQYQKQEGRGGLWGTGFGPVGGFWGRGSGCLNWIIGLLLGLLLLFLLSLLLRMCSGGILSHRTPIVTEEEVVTTEQVVTDEGITSGQPQHQLPAPVVEGELEKEKVTTETEVDYEAVRALIQEYQERINELAKMLPESDKK